MFQALFGTQEKWHFLTFMAFLLQMKYCNIESFWLYHSSTCRPPAGLFFSLK